MAITYYKLEHSFGHKETLQKKSVQPVFTLGLLLASVAAVRYLSIDETYKIAFTTVDKVCHCQPPRSGLSFGMYFPTL